LPNLGLACGARTYEIKPQIFLDAIGHAVRSNVRPASRKGAHSNGLANIRVS
jgi:hypothetical protein